MTKTNFDGMTVTNCCDDCNIEACVISGKPYCAHPRKGGLHSSEMQDADALKRHRSAIAFLARAEAQDKSKRAMAED
jgi:hypothetical protein